MRCGDPFPFHGVHSQTRPSVPSRSLPPLFHEPCAECALCLELILGAAAQADIVGGRQATARHGLDVVELQMFAG